MQPYIHVVSSKPNIKRVRIECNSCKKYKLCIRSYNEPKCKECYKKETSKNYTSVVYCLSCAHLVLEDEIKWCSNCKDEVGPCCGALYHCQSAECICKNCFDYKCEKCGSVLSKDKQYTSDSADENKPICIECVIETSCYKKI